MSIIEVAFAMMSIALSSPNTSASASALKGRFEMNKLSEPDSSEQFFGSTVKL